MRKVVGYVRWPSGAVIVGAFLISYLSLWLVVAGHSGIERAWRVVRVPAEQRSFDDARLILEGVDCVRRGRNPHHDTECDWRYRTLNYPSIWLSLRHVGLTVQQTNPIGIGIGLVFIIAVLLSFWRSLPLAGVIGGACVISPAVMLGIERGNTDLIVFSLLVSTSVLASRYRRFGDIVLAIGILITAGLKLYPIAAIVALLRPNKRALAVASSAIAFFACWVYYWRADLSLISVNTPNSDWYSFGYKTFFISVFHFIEPAVQMDPSGRLASTHLPLPLEITARIALLLATALSVAFGLQVRRRWTIDLDFRDRTQLQFLIGSSIYVGTFALGTNFNYRLVFLVLCIPQLVEWIVHPCVSRSLRSIAVELAAGVAAICWVSAVGRFPFPISNASMILLVAAEIISWSLFMGFGVILTVQLMTSLPHPRPLRSIEGRV
jgi:hypothetical protein